MELKGKKDEERKKAAPGIPFLSGSSASSSGLSMGAAQIGARSPMAKLSALLSSQPAMIATITAVFTIAAIGLKDINERRKAGEAFLHFPAKDSVAADSRLTGYQNLPGSEADPAGLSLAAQANVGFYGDGAPGEAGADEGEDVDGEVDEAEGAALGSAEELKAAAAAAAAAGGEEAADGEGVGAKDGVKPRMAGKLAKSRIGGSRMVGGAAMGPGGSTPGPSVNTGRSKDLKAGRKKVLTRGKRTAGSRGKGRLRGATANRLSRMNKAMGQARKSKASAAAGVHRNQWAGAGTAGDSITGAGASGAAGGGPMTTGTGGAGLQNGGPMGSGQSDGYGAGGGEAGGVGPAKNVTPWQKEMDLVMILLPIAGLLLMAATLMGKSKNPATLGIAKILAYGAAVIAGIATAIGVMIMSKGQMMQGGMIAGVGAILTVMSVLAAQGIDQDQEAAQLKQLGENGHSSMLENLDGHNIVDTPKDFNAGNLKAGDSVYQFEGRTFTNGPESGQLIEFDPGALNFKNFPAPEVPVVAGNP